MIAHLKGKVISLEGGKVIVDVSGVGYDVLVSNSLSQKIKLNQETSLSIYTDVKETDISLYGFSDKTEKHVFLMLRTVKGIGSKLALTVVSLVGAGELLSIVSLEDLTSLQKVPGIGKKSAERIIVELREKVISFLEDSGGQGFTLNSQIEVSNFKNFSSAQLDAAAALEKLGFSKEQVQLALDKASIDLKDTKYLEDPGELLKVSLSKLA